MAGRQSKSRDLLSFEEEASVINDVHSRPASQRRNPPRLMSAGSKSRQTTNSRAESSGQKIKSSLFNLKDLRKAKLQERQDNLPTLEFDRVKWIPIISAYDPGRLKNITVKKQSFQEFFGKHNPNQDPLGQLYIQSVIEHFKQWQQKINRRYSRILDEFISSNGFMNWQAIEAELDGIEKMTGDMKDILKTILRKYENHRIRKLIEGYQRALDKSSEILAIINIVYQSKHRIQTILQKLEGKRDLKKILKNLRNSKIQQTRQVFKKYAPNQYEDEIVDKVAEAINSMANMTVDAIDKLESMKHIIERVHSILKNKDQNLGLKGLDKINQIFESVLDEARVFKESGHTIAENNFFNEDFKNKAAFYEKEMQSKKGLVIEYIFGIVDSILASMVQTYQQYYSITEPLQRAPESFSQLKSGLRNLAKNLVKEQLPQGRLVLNFVDSISKNLDTLKNHSQELIALQKKAQGTIYFDNKEYLDIVKQITSLTTSYKHNVKELIRKFAKMRAELHSRENNSGFFSRPESQIVNVQLPETDPETQYISNLYKLCVFFTNTNVESMPVFAPTKIDFFKDLSSTRKDLDIASEELKKISQRYKEFQRLAKNNEIRDITGDLKVGSKLLENVENLVNILEMGNHIEEANVEAKIGQCRASANSIVKQAPQVQKLYEKIILSKLSRFLKPQLTEQHIKQLQKLIEQNKDCSKQVAFHTNRSAFVSTLCNNLSTPIDTLIHTHLLSLSAELTYLLSIHQTKLSLHSSNNLYYPNSEFISNIVSTLFTWLFINRSENTDKIQKELIQKKKIMGMQRNKLGELKELKVYQEVKVIKQQVDQLEDESEQLEEAFKRVRNVIDRGDREVILISYADFLNDCLNYLTETKQLFFCLISSKNEPVYLAQLNEADCFGLISRFLTCINLPFTKQWLSRLKNDWKVDNYIIKKPEKQKITNKVTAKRAEEPAELIEVEPGDQIIDDMDVGEDVAEEAIEDMAQEMIEEVEEMPMEDMPEDLVQDDMADEQIEEESFKEKPSNKKAPASASSKKISSSPSKSQKQSLVKQKEEPKRPRKSQYIKMGKIESIKALINSLVIYEGFSDSYRKQIDPSLYENVVNSIYLEKFLHKNAKFNELSVLAPCRQNIRKAKKVIDDRIKNNILKDFICMESKYKKITNTLKEIQDKIASDTLTDTILYKVSQLILQLLNALDLPVSIVKDIKTHIVYLTRDTNLRGHFIVACLAKFDLKFNEKQLVEIGQTYLLNSEEPNVLTLTTPQQLNVFENNKAIKDIQTLLAFTDWPKLYNLSNIHELILSLWEGNPKCELVVKQVHDRNRQKIDPVRREQAKYAVRFSGMLNTKVEAFEHKIQQAEEGLLIENGPVDLVKIDGDIKKIKENYLLKDRQLNYCMDADTNLYFMLSEANPEPIVKTLISSYFPSLNPRLLKQIKPKQIKDNSFIYSLPDIISSVTKIFEKDEQEQTQQFKKFYDTINNQMFGSSKQGNCQKIFEKGSKQLEQVLKCRVITHNRLKPLMSGTTKKLKEKKTIIDFLDKVGIVNSWEQYNKAGTLLQAPELPVRVPYALVYSSDGVLYRIFNGQDLKEVNRKICNMLGKNTSEVQIKQQTISNGGTLLTLPKHHIKFEFNQDIPKAKKYLGQQLSLNIKNNKNELYSGPLVPSVDIQYSFPQIQQLTIAVLNNSQVISQETFKDVEPADRLTSQKAEKAVKAQVDQKIEEQRQQRLRRQQEERQRKRREEEEKRRLEEEERKRKAEEERIRRQQQQRKRKEQQDRRRQQEQKKRKQQEEKRRLQELQLAKIQQQRKRLQEEQRVKQEQLLKQKQQPDIGFDQGQQNYQQSSAPVAPKRSSLTRPSTESRRAAAVASRKKAEQNSIFKAQSEYLLQRDIMLKTPEQVIDQRGEEDKPSELGEYEIFEESVTPSQGCDHHDLKNQNLKEVDFLKILKDKAGEQKYNLIKKRLEDKEETQSHV